MSNRSLLLWLLGIVVVCNLLAFVGAWWWPDAWLSRAVRAAYDTSIAVGAAGERWSAGFGRAEMAGSVFLVTLVGCALLSGFRGRRARRAGRHAEPSIPTWLAVAVPLAGGAAWPLVTSYVVLGVLAPAAVLLAAMVVYGGSGPASSHSGASWRAMATTDAKVRDRAEC